MGALIRILFPAIGYFCVATVITLTAGYAYLRSNGSLDDENMFQIVSLVHGIDLDEIASANQTDQQDIPPEEMSFDERRQHLLMANLLLQAKQDDIEKNISIFKSEQITLANSLSHFEKFKVQVEQFLTGKKDEALAAGLAAVRAQWKILNPKQTKQMLMRMIKDGQMEWVIELLNGLSAKDREAIFKTFDTQNDEDVDILYRIEQEMLTGGPEAKFIDGKLKDLNQAKN